jgi:hypothetical protein
MKTADETTFSHKGITEHLPIPALQSDLPQPFIPSITLRQKSQAVRQYRNEPSDLSSDRSRRA